MTLFLFIIFPVNMWVSSPFNPWLGLTYCEGLVAVAIYSGATIINCLHYLRANIEQVFFFTNGGILIGYQSFLGLHLSGTPNQKTGTSPPSCQLLDNCLYMPLLSLI